MMAIPQETGIQPSASPNKVPLTTDRSNAGKRIDAVRVSPRRVAAYTNHLSCARSAPRDRRNRRSRETTAATRTAPVRIPNTWNGRDSSTSLMVRPLKPIGLGTVRPAASSVDESADRTVTDAIKRTDSHSTGRHRLEGRPEGNRSRGNRVDVPRRGYQYHVCVQAASSAAGEPGPRPIPAAEKDHSSQAATADQRTCTPSPPSFLFNARSASAL